MKKTTVLLFLVFVAFGTFAQDILVLKDGTRIEVVLESISDDEIRYRRYGQVAGPLYSKSRKSVAVIEYENGVVEPFGSSKAVMEITDRNLIGYNYFDMVTLNFAFSYERLLDEEGNVSLYLPIRIGFAQDNSYLEDPNVFGVGLGFNVYPFGQRKVSYYTGAMIHYSIRETYVYTDYYDAELEQWIYNSYYDDHNFLGGYVTNGLKLNFNDRLGLNFNLALGFLMDLDYEDRNNQPYYYSDRTRFHALGEISLFYRF